MGPRDYIGGEPEEASPDRGFLDDASVVLDVGRGGRDRGEVGDVARPAGPVQGAQEPQLVGQGDEVGLLALLVEGDDARRRPRGWR